MSRSGQKAARSARSAPKVSRSDGVPVRLYGLRRGTTTLMTLVSALFAVFILAPLGWLLISSTKTQAEIYNSSGFWFAGPFRLFQNLSALGRNVSGAGVYLNWLENTLLYALLGGIGSTALSALAGYGFARFRFRGADALFSLVMSTLLVPISALALPLFLVYAKVGMVNSIWGMILPSMVSPVGIYLMRTFIDASVPRDLINAARIDGAGEFRIFWQIVLPLTVPGLVTVLLLTVVAVWNNYFLPLVIFSHSNLYPLTVGLSALSQAAETGSQAQAVPVLIAGGLVTVLPLIALFLVLERYFRGGALQGSLTS
ncbi:carbohydrate ABC transporter permease [Actinospica sp.]|jgi:multiple sugar transport system permease protein|uniref:carbohydrate ABC transporter permease n=1 Tax=Actinospica sp. TaxID=1872142 RepID=UPI002BE876AF|nr:carbohydrate ABC transporter permease [Actinospica sp.]HWG24157.1 carbohydrate ABC transporter permease [Actinospica sp.]